MEHKVVAIFGGSFNPIHYGHIALARSVVQTRAADEVWLLISPQNPLKEQRELQPENVRLTLARKALMAERNIIVTDFEFHLPRPSYTWNTLEELRKAYPHYTFKLLIGADNWLVFDHWKNFQDILNNYSLLVYPRQDSPINPSSLPKNVELIQSPLMPFSSTDIRKKVKQNEDINGMLPLNIVADVKSIYKA